MQGAVEGRITPMLVDTGSSVTLLHEKVWKEAVQGRRNLQPSTGPVKAVNSENLPICGQAEVSLQVGEYVGVHKVLVVKEMIQECLLGTDFLEKGHCVIDVKNKLLTIAGCTKPVHMLQRGEMVHESTVIPAFHQVQLPVDLELAQDNRVPDCIGLFEPKPEFPDKHGGLLVAHSVSPTHNGQTTVQLLNPTAVPVTLYGKETIGELSWLGESNMVGLVEPSLDKKPAVRSENAICKAIEEILKKVQGITVSEREELRALLKEHSDVISVGDGDLGRTSVLRHKIDTGNATPIHHKLPFHQRGLVQNMIEGMLDQGIVDPAEGAWSSPIVLAKKKDGSHRFCVDFRRVNDVTKKDVHPIPRIDDALDSLAGMKLFSVLDLASGYWQVELDPADKDKTAFATPFGLHQFRVMPFGLTNAPSTFQRLMSLVLSGLCWETCLVYLDDIIVFSQTVAEHLQRLAEVLRRLKNAGLKIKPSKCQLLSKSVQYLGHVVSEKGVQADPTEISCVRDWTVPDSWESLRRFLGFASYYRKFIPNFSQIAAPLHTLTERSKPWYWKTQCEDAFVALKSKLLSPPILSFPQFDKTLSWIRMLARTVSELYCHKMETDMSLLMPAGC